LLQENRRADEKACRMGALDFNNTCGHGCLPASVTGLCVIATDNAEVILFFVQIISFCFKVGSMNAYNHLVSSSRTTSRSVHEQRAGRFTIGVGIPGLDEKAKFDSLLTVQ
jgi:hypothetical protein